MSTETIIPEVVSPLSVQVQTPGKAIQLKDTIRNFLNNSASGETRASYARSINEFLRFAGKHPFLVSVGDVLAWRDKLKSSKQSDQTVAAKLSAVRSLYKYLISEYPEAITKNPADTQLVRPPKVTSILKGRALTTKEVNHLLAGPDKNAVEGARDYAMMLLMLRLSLRVSEVGNIKTSSMQWKGGRWTLTLKVKGGTEEIWPLPADVKTAINDYLKLDKKRRDTFPETRVGDQFVFQPLKNHRSGTMNRGLTRQMIFNVVRKWAEFVGIEGQVSPHDLRRTAITRALNQGRTYREVQMMSKHKDPKTVMRYDYELDNLDRNPVNTLDYEEN